MPKYKLFISGNLGSTATFEVRYGNHTFRESTNRKLRLNFWQFLRHVTLEYHAAQLSKISLIKITIVKLIQTFILFPQIVLGFFLSRYTVTIELPNSIPVSPEIYWSNDNQEIPLWVSRQSQIKGFYYHTSDQELEWNMFRSSKKMGYLLDIYQLEKSEVVQVPPFNIGLQPMAPLEINSIVAPSPGSSRTLILEDVLIDRTQIHFKEGVAYPIHNFDYFEQTSLPTPLIFSREGKHFYYPILNLDVQEVPVVTSIPYSENWYHFIFESLSAFFRQEYDVVKSPILVRATCPKNITQLLTYLTGYEPVILRNRTSILAEKLVLIQEWQYKNRFDFSSRANDIREIKFRLAQVFQSKHLTSEAMQTHEDHRNSIIFLKRPFGIYRQMINYSEALEVLKEKGITIVDPSTLDFFECYSLVHSAKVVIVETGAAMTNLLFCQSGTNILEINPDGFEPFFWSGLIKILELNHQRITAHTKKGTFNQKFVFPINEVCRALQL
jgi:hypothetical protein